MITPKDKIIKQYVGLKNGTGFNPKGVSHDQWSFGAIKGDSVRPDGQWVKYLPKDEPQERVIETMNCTVYGTLNQIDMLLTVKGFYEEDKSERFNGILAGTTPNGNNPQKAYESIRKDGLISESLLPFDDAIESWGDYYSPKPMLQKFRDHGEKWLEEYDFKHEWVANNRLKVNAVGMMNALTFSPICIGVSAWIRNGDIYIKDGRDNHWTTVVGFVEGKYWIVYDSYAPHIKHLEWDYPFTWAKRISIEKLNKPRPVEVKESKQSLYNKLMKCFMKLVKLYPELGSSQNPEKLALHVKGIIGAVVAVLSIMLPVLPVDIDLNVLESFTETLPNIVVSTVALWSAYATIWGKARTMFS